MARCQTADGGGAAGGGWRTADGGVARCQTADGGVRLVDGGRRGGTARAGEPGG